MAFEQTNIFDCKQTLWPITTDLFASRINNHYQRLFSWHNDLEAIAVDAFEQPWPNESLSAFPPFSVIGKLIQKIRLEETELTLITPIWPTQHWFAVVLCSTAWDSLSCYRQTATPFAFRRSQAGNTRYGETSSDGLYIPYPEGYPGSRNSKQCCPIHLGCMARQHAAQVLVILGKMVVILP